MLLAKTLDYKLTIVALVYFNLQKKTYELLDRVSIENCKNATLLRDDDTFGLFFVSSTEDESGVSPHNIIFKNWQFLEIDGREICIDNRWNSIKSN
jgi:hypothetical protein